ncbi:ABC transporter ATP-binding protein [Oceaniovalibus sp. ACAM 378]|uniref:ABC transporter ATP-binding protein n=1 Tax=Oceaniovalibus sp. ACAM 378 TaxID=2599923 RepID=UPI0011DA3486|nr:ABC transporter ATP-binding protein [Oceaniovalibus sp. ACAM 378]TYB90087.1 ABC transporter ATP-binding protein [Oceaniovalibus sp. ACAM 378]
MSDPFLKVRGLTAAFTTRGRDVQVLNGLDFDMAAGEAIGIVGESGSGKSVTARALMQLAPEGSSIRLGGSVTFQGQDLLQYSERQMQTLRGSQIAMVFQDPMTSLNPTMTVGAQIDDMLRRHKGLSARPARDRTVELLERVGIHNARRRADDHPHQFSGGMRQRVMIAMAISCDPALLIADEPTTALDVTVQAQILRLLLQLREDLGMALMLITHDFGVIAGMVERVMVMYRGDIVETGPVERIFDAPEHLYTRALLAAVPRLDAPEAKP